MHSMKWTNWKAFHAPCPRTPMQVVKTARSFPFPLAVFTLYAGFSAPAFCQAPVVQTPDPVSAVSDPGVITTNQIITPAGAQKIFEGRVYGVAFGDSSRSLFVTVASPSGDLSPAYIYALDWKSNSITGKWTIEDSSGLQGGSYDPVSNSLLLSGLHAETSASGQNTGTSIRVLSVDSSGEHLLSGSIGENEVGHIAVTGNKDRANHLAVVPLTFNNEVAVLDLDTRAIRFKVKTGIAPFAAVVNAAGTVAFISNWGGRFPTAHDQTARMGSEDKPDTIVVDSRGIAASGTVSKIDLLSGKVVSSVSVGLHPTALAWDEKGDRVYVANSNSDSITVLDAEKTRVVDEIKLQPFHEKVSGISPESVVLSPDGEFLYVACSGINAIAKIALHRDATESSRIIGLIPTGWYPASLTISPDGQYLAVGALLGVGSGWNSADVDDLLKENHLSGGRSPKRRYAHAYRGMVQLLAIPNESELANDSLAVAHNNHLRLTNSQDNPGVAGDKPATPSPIPAHLGDPSTINHVVFIIKENRSYDQLFGGLEKGNGDPSLQIYGEDILPNHRRLARQFVLLDNFYATGGDSADGHQWVTQANETDYAYWQAYNGRSYPKNGDDPMAFANGGFLWDNALRHSKTFADFGEFAGWFSNKYKYSAYSGYLHERTKLLDEYRKGMEFNERFHTMAPIRPLNKHLVADYPSFGLQIPDVVRAKIFLHHLNQWETSGQMPNLVLVQLPSDHTIGTTPEVSSPAACLADNDLALGQIVDGLSHSKFWKSMLIFVVEDDAQYGLDHVDGHRTVALAISPYIRRGSIDSTFYSQTSMVKTIEMILGLPPMSLFDSIANDMHASFDLTPDLTPYEAVTPNQSIYEVNPKLTALTGPARDAAIASSHMNFSVPDAAPANRMNRILWQDAKGWHTAIPEIAKGAFVPLEGPGKGKDD